MSLRSNKELTDAAYQTLDEVLASRNISIRETEEFAKEEKLIRRTTDSREVERHWRGAIYSFLIMTLSVLIIFVVYLASSASTTDGAITSYLVYIALALFFVGLISFFFRISTLAGELGKEPLTWFLTMLLIPLGTLVAIAAFNSYVSEYRKKTTNVVNTE